MDRVYRAFIGTLFETGSRMIAKRYLHQLQHAQALSEQTLRRILALNGTTEWGRAHGFDQPDALAAFHQMAPTMYQDYAPYIERAAAGEPNMLTSDPISYFAVTSGTTGAQKLIPSTRRQTRATLELMFVPVGLGLLSGTMTTLRGRSMMILTEQISGETPGGIPKGAATSNGLRTMGPLFEWLWTSPLLVAQIQEQTANRYLHMLFGLGEEYLWSITGFFPSTLLFAFRDLHTYADELLHDLANGTITRRLELAPDVRASLERKLRPNPRRAHQIARLREQGRFSARDIWPHLRVVLCAGSGTFRFYTDQLKPYLGDVPVFSASYAASEAVIGVGLSANRLGYALAPNAAYHEFLPLDADGQPILQPLSLAEVEVGQSYEIVVTTYAGLTRYRLGDIIKVIDRYGEAPVIDFVERRGQVINVVGEKTGEAQIARAFEEACRGLGASVLDYIVTTDLTFTPARYLVLVEALAAEGATRASVFDPALLLEAFEQHLCRVAPDYGDSRRMGELGPMVLRMLRSGTFERYRALRVAQGASAAQVKVPHAVPDARLVDQQFFDSVVADVVPVEER